MLNIIKDDNTYTISEVENKWPLDFIIVRLIDETKKEHDSLCKVYAISDDYDESMLYASRTMTKENHTCMTVRFGTNFYNESKGGKSSTLELIEDGVFYEYKGTKRFANRFILFEKIYDETGEKKYRVQAAADKLQDLDYYVQVNNLDMRYHPRYGNRWTVVLGEEPTNIIGHIPGVGYILDESCTDENGEYCERSN